ncbi:MAG: TonB-dependent receptor [Gammaproteobacteria bacterium]|nr:TonB-dependent receptor [Gammaproteobacteria bacterium]
MAIQNARTLRSLIAGMTIGCGLAAVAHAADQPGTGAKASDVLQEIIVTGTKRRVASQDVPISISAISGKELQNIHINDIKALGELAPGLVLSNPAGFNAAGGGMRGTGTNIILVTQDAPVSFLVDDFVLSQVTSQFVTLFDTQQVEVYRGPQGTLFGANATGGVISIITKKPELGKYYEDSEATYGQYGNGAGIASLKTAFNVPISHTLAFRLAAIYDYDAGYYTDDKHTATFPNNVPLWGLFGIPQGTPLPPGVNAQTTGTGERLGGRDVLAAKAKLLWKPTDNYTAYLIGEVVHDRSGSPPGVNESQPTDLLPLLGFPGIQQAGQTNVFSTLITNNSIIRMQEGHRVDDHGLYLTQTYDAPFGQFKSISGYRDEISRLPSTYTGESFTTLFDSMRNTDRHTFEQEFRFASNFKGPFNFIAGANYIHDSFDFLAYYSVGLTALIPVQDPTTGTFVTPQGYVSLNTEALNDYQFQGTQQTRHQDALYWDGTFKFNKQWSFTGGVRFSQDHKKFLRFVDGGGPCTALTAADNVENVNGQCFDSHSNFISRAGIAPGAFNGGVFAPLPLTAFGTVVNTEGSWSKTTFRTVLNYKPTSSQLAYLSYATGFLSGGFSETCATVARCKYNPETNGSLELGYKSDWLGDTLRFNAAAYVTTYKNLQQAVVAAYTASDGTGQQETVTVNTGESRATGLDLESNWLATDSLRVDASVNYLHHVYLSGAIPDLLHIPAGPSTQLTQYRVTFSPTWKADLALTYHLPFSNMSRWSVRADGNYQGTAETDVYNGPNTQMQSRLLLNLSATYQSADGNWSFTPWVENATDKVYRVAALPVAGLWNFTNYGPPRSFGITADLHFE